MKSWKNTKYFQFVSNSCGSSYPGSRGAAISVFTGQERATVWPNRKSFHSDGLEDSLGYRKCLQVVLNYLQDFSKHHIANYPLEKPTVTQMYADRWEAQTLQLLLSLCLSAVWCWPERKLPPSAVPNDTMRAVRGWTKTVKFNKTKTMCWNMIQRSSELSWTASWWMSVHLEVMIVNIKILIIAAFWDMFCVRLAINLFQP